MASQQGGLAIKVQMLELREKNILKNQELLKQEIVSGDRLVLAQKQQISHLEKLVESSNEQF